MSDQQRRYRSYLLRVWQETSDDALTWRVSLEDVMTHQQFTFTTVASLIAFLTTPPTDPSTYSGLASAGRSTGRVND